MNLGEAKTRVMQLIDEYSVRGSVIGRTDGNVADYHRKAKNFLDMAQKKVAEKRYIYRTKTYTHYVPFVGRVGSFEDAAERIFTFPAKKAYAYSFYVYGEVTAYIEGVTENGIVEEITSIECGRGDSFVGFSGQLDFSTEYSALRLRFVGSSRYIVRSPALFLIKYAEIPFLADYIQYPLPTNYNKLLKADAERPSGRTERYTDYVFTEAGKIGFALCKEGIINVTYAAFPETITAETPDDHEMELDDNGLTAMCLYAAALLIQLEDFSAFTQFMNQYLDIMSNSNNRLGLSQARVKRVW